MFKLPTGALLQEDFSAQEYVKLRKGNKPLPHSHSKPDSPGAMQAAKTRATKAYLRHRRTFGALTAVVLPGSPLQPFPFDHGAPSSCVGVLKCTAQALSNVMLLEFPAGLLEPIITQAQRALQKKVDFLRAAGVAPTKVPKMRGSGGALGITRSSAADADKLVAGAEYPDSFYNLFLGHCRIVVASKRTVATFGSIGSGATFLADEVAVVLSGELEQVPPLGSNGPRVAEKDSASDSGAVAGVESDGHSNAGGLSSGGTGMANSGALLAAAGKIRAAQDLEAAYPEQEFQHSLRSMNEEAVKVLVDHGRNANMQRLRAQLLLDASTLPASSGHGNSVSSNTVRGPEQYTPFVAGCVVATLGPGSVFGPCNVVAQSAPRGGENASNGAKASELSVPFAGEGMRTASVAQAADKTTGAPQSKTTSRVSPLASMVNTGVNHASTSSGATARSQSSASTINRRNMSGHQHADLPSRNLQMVGKPTHSGSRRTTTRHGDTRISSLFVVKTPQAVLLVVRPGHVPTTGMSDHEKVFVAKTLHRLQHAAAEHATYAVNRVREMDGMHVRLQLMNAELATKHKTKSRIAASKAPPPALRGSWPTSRSTSKKSKEPNRNGRKNKHASRGKRHNARVKAPSENASPLRYIPGGKSKRLPDDTELTLSSKESATSHDQSGSRSPPPEQLLKESIVNDFNKWPARSKLGYADSDHKTFDFDIGQQQMLQLVNEYAAKQRAHRKHDQQPHLRSRRASGPRTGSRVEIRQASPRRMNPHGVRPDGSREFTPSTSSSGNPFFPTISAEPGRGLPETGVSAVHAVQSSNLHVRPSQIHYAQQVSQALSGSSLAESRSGSQALQRRRKQRRELRSDGQSRPHTSHHRQSLSIGSLAGQSVGTGGSVLGNLRGKAAMRRWKCVSSSGGVFYRASANMLDKLPDGVACGCSVLAQTTRRGEWLYTQDGKWLPLSPALTGEVSFEEVDSASASSRLSRRGSTGSPARPSRKKAVRMVDGSGTPSEKQRRQADIDERVRSLVAFKQQHPHVTIMSFADCK